MKGKKMGFTADTYICLDVTMPVAQQIMDIRVRSRDTFRAALPVEITLVGSSGVGVLDIRQDEKIVFALLDTIAAETEPLQVTFGKVLSLRISQSFRLDMLSVYMLNIPPITTLYRVKLTGKPKMKDLSETFCER